MSSTLAVALLATAAGGSTQPIVGGPLIAGVCVISPEAVLASSKVGQAANARLQQITLQAQQPLQAERTTIEAEAKTIRSPSPTLFGAQLEQKRQALSQHLQAFEARATQRSRELEATRVQVIERISQQTQPLIATAYTKHGCGLLFRRTDLLGGNMANDLTAEVISALDAKQTSLDFNLNTLPVTPTNTPTH